MANMARHSITIKSHPKGIEALRGALTSKEPCSANTWRLRQFEQMVTLLDDGLAVWFEAAWHYRDDLLEGLAAEFPFLTIAANLHRENEWEVNFDGLFVHGKLKGPWRMKRSVICATRQDIDFPDRDKAVGATVKVRHALTARREAAQITEIDGDDITLQPFGPPDSDSLDSLRSNGRPGESPRWPKGYDDIQYGKYGDRSSDRIESISAELQGTMGVIAAKDRR